MEYRQHRGRIIPISEKKRNIFLTYTTYYVQGFFNIDICTYVNINLNRTNFHLGLWIK